MTLRLFKLSIPRNATIATGSRPENTAIFRFRLNHVKKSPVGEWHDDQALTYTKALATLVSASKMKNLRNGSVANQVSAVRVAMVNGLQACFRSVTIKFAEDILRTGLLLPSPLLDGLAGSMKLIRRACTVEQEMDVEEQWQMSLRKKVLSSKLIPVLALLTLTIPAAVCQLNSNTASVA